MCLILGSHKNGSEIGNAQISIRKHKFIFLYEMNIMNNREMTNLAVTKGIHK